MAKVSGHLVAVIDGTMRDTHSPARGGLRCVYGVFYDARDAATVEALYLWRRRGLTQREARP